MKVFKPPTTRVCLPTSTYNTIKTPSLFSRRCSTSSGSIIPLGFEKMSDVVVGIDLGTTNSCVALMEDNKPRVLENVEGMRTTPSVVAFLENGQVLVGHTAKRQAQINSESTIYAAKRLIGRSWNDPEIQREARNLPFKIVPGPNGSAAWVQARGKMYSPSQIAAYVLEKMKQAAEVHVRAKVGRAVVTVPAYFNDGQRQATRDAGRIAGLRVERIINEPTAAALAYGFKEESGGKRKTVAVYDLGGGTFDISVLDIGQGVFEVKATNGDTYLGGEDFDQVILKQLLVEAKKKSGVDFSNNSIAVSRLREAAEKAKCELSSVRTTEINLPFLGMTSDNQPFHFSLDITRVQLENLVNHLVQKTKPPCEKCVKDANISSVDEVILVGGMTRMPKVQAVCEQIFGKPPNKSVNPDEAVAIGAAIQAGVLQGQVSGLVLVDVIPLSLGVELHDGKMSVFVPRNTKTPFRASQTFTTVENYQQDVSFKVYQGERPRAADNKLLAQFTLKVPPLPRGVVSMECAFNIGLDGILKVTAKDNSTGREANLEIRASTGLSETEIEKMVQEANENREMDQKRFLITSTINEIEAAIQAAETNMTEFHQQISQANKESIKAAVTKARECLVQQNASKTTSLPGSAYALVKDTINTELGQLQAVLANLTKVVNPIIEQAYKSKKN